MKALMIAASAAAVAMPMVASTPADARPREVRQEMRECNRELRHADSNREYRKELRECRREVAKAKREVRRDRRDERRDAMRDWRRYRNFDWNRYEPGYNHYYADRYYRDGRYYADRRVTRYDRIYRGSDGRFYCRRDDGTTGLILGGAVGAALGSQLHIGGSTTLSAILGGTAGALIGREIDRGELRCD